jgi:hypothetical protein
MVDIPTRPIPTVPPLEHNKDDRDLWVLAFICMVFGSALTLGILIAIGIL